MISTNLHAIAAEKALNAPREGRKLTREQAIAHLKTMGFFRKPIAIHVSRALRYEYGR